MEKNDIIRFRENINRYWLSHTIKFTFSLVIFGAFFSGHVKSLVLLIIGGLNAIYSIFSMIYANKYSWNTFIYFDDEKAYQIRKGKYYEWYYKDMISCKDTWRIPYYNFSIVSITTKNTNINLNFEIDGHRARLFISKCKNEEIINQLRKGFSPIDL